MPNFEQYNSIPEHPNPSYRKKLLKGEAFKFSEEEKARKIESGMSSEEIEEKEREVIKRQRLSREEERESEKSVNKKLSFEEYKAQQEREYQEKLEEMERMKKAT